MKRVDCSPGAPAKRGRARGELAPLTGLEHHAAMRYRHPVAVDRVIERGDAPARPEVRVQVAYQLVPIEVEVDPVGVAPSLGAAEHPAVKAPRFGDVPHLNRDVKGCQGHAITSSGTSVSVHCPHI